MSAVSPRSRTGSTAPERGCRLKEYRYNGAVVRRLFPPAPGLSARRAGPREVVVTYRFAPFDPRCRPTSLELTVDTNDDRLPGEGTAAPIHGPRGEVSVPLPDGLRKADVVRGMARTRDHRPGNSTAVLIR
jgi:hypothetical protein